MQFRTSRCSECWEECTLFASDLYNEYRLAPLGTLWVRQGRKTRGLWGCSRSSPVGQFDSIVSLRFLRWCSNLWGLLQVVVRAASIQFWRCSASKLFQFQVLMAQARSQWKDPQLRTLSITESWLHPVQFPILLPQFWVIPSPHLHSAAAQSRPSQKRPVQIPQLPFGHQKWYLIRPLRKPHSG